MAYTTKFSNNTDYKIYLSTWIQFTPGLNKNAEFEIEPGKEVTLHSATGEWEINDYFYDDNISKWHNSGYRRREYIGKFRLDPCYQGNRVWLENDKYDVVYDEGFVFKNR